jgi:hypothetical protein
MRRSRSADRTPGACASECATPQPDPREREAFAFDDDKYEDEYPDCTIPPLYWLTGFDCKE